MTPVAVDKGPECEGGATKGLHLFSQAATALPGGTSVTYAEGHADGTHRTAELTTGSTWLTVEPAQRVDLGGHTYTVAQICTYRVVLTGPGLHAPTERGEKMTDWPMTRDGILSLAWHTPNSSTGGDQVVVTDVESGPLRCAVHVVHDSRPAGTFRDVPVGGTIEFAGRLWKVAHIDTGNMAVSVASRDFKPGHVTLQELGDA
ncbi:hypothetical protein [Streptomyces sp. NBC_00448]|uniref:hypothetical protein n=1 Tax=Streptomyces sp. NBC_00448 TaxID=2903652 RepID=UPI002E1DAC2E